MSGEFFIIRFFGGNYSFDAQEFCQAQYNIDISKECHINFFPNDTVESYGTVQRGEFMGNADIAGIGVVVGFCPGIFLCLLGVVFGLREWAGRSRRVSRWAKKRKGVTMLFDPTEERSPSWTRLYSVLSNLIIANADTQLFIALAYGINFALSSKCNLSVYHYKVGLNMVLLALASSNLSILMVRSYWQRAWIAASMRVIVMVVILAFLGRMIAYQFTRTSRPEDMLYSKLRDSNRTDSSILLPMSCFLDPDLDPLQALTDTQLARVGGDLRGKDVTSEIVLYGAVAFCFLLAHTAHVMRKLRGHHPPKQEKPQLWGWIVMGYWAFTLLTSVVAVRNVTALVVRRASATSNISISISMAHQTANIPWNVLASNFKWTQTGRTSNGDLHLRFRPQQGKELHYFVEAFIRNVRDHAKTSRKKYPVSYEAPHPDSIVLDDTTVQKITPTIRRWRAHSRQLEGEGRLYQPSVKSTSGVLCQHTSREDKGCQCTIPFEERRASAFYRQYESNPCYYFFRYNEDAFFNQEIVKALLLYGEMNTILRVCAIPDVDLKSWWSVAQCYCGEYDAGWDQICARALVPYIALNLIYCFPETWDDASGRTDEKDYRLMRIYQMAIRYCTESDSTSEVPSHPHRRFFGIEDNQFKWIGTRDLCGKVPFEKFLNLDTETQQKPSPSAVAQVQHILYSKGLPMEMVLDILEMAEYEPGEGRLIVPHDPLHLENRDELAKYLRYCWELLVRCEMMANAIGMEIPWIEVMNTALEPLLDSGALGGRKWHRRDWTEGTYTFV
ncbi:uncharacterized protein DNG_03736 [Cephalotrichum gorgonifer]|uniref:Uncharacterized protein n=1 Tax=Cephalotrichum gorgonifer TaxID=2041049 RepID=A0AAE8SU93_9PEZI|nr:uncharacterized protein DNG_03736 [Cephalotrichum gorgonifer]